jgi:hypothetical protein
MLYFLRNSPFLFGTTTILGQLGTGKLASLIEPAQTAARYDYQFETSIKSRATKRKATKSMFLFGLMLS